MTQLMLQFEFLYRLPAVDHVHRALLTLAWNVWNWFRFYDFCCHVSIKPHMMI